MGQLVDWSSGRLEDFQADLLAGLLLAEEFGGQVGLDASVRDKDAALAVFGTGARMDADSRTSRHVTNERHKTAEARGLRDAQRVYERRDKKIEVLEGVANKLITVSCSSVELAANGFTFRMLAKEFVIAHGLLVFWSTG